MEGSAVQEQHEFRERHLWRGDNGVSTQGADAVGAVEVWVLALGLEKQSTVPGLM